VEDDINAEADKMVAAIQSDKVKLLSLIFRPRLHWLRTFLQRIYMWGKLDESNIIGILVSVLQSLIRPNSEITIIR